MTGDDHSAVVDFCFKTYEVPISSAYNVTVIDDSKELLSQQNFIFIPLTSMGSGISRWVWDGYLVWHSGIPM